jgi:GntR family transcriptional repressor for pyruvate dehydrogenase complex
MKIEAVKVRRLYLEIANQIESQITTGKISVGERLPSERDLAERFGVSRPTIREAMIALEIAGLVEIRTGSGIYVKQQSNNGNGLVADEGPGAFEILEARRLIESETAVLAAARITDKQLKELEQALEVMNAEDKESTVSEQADKRFHCIIAEASGNSALAATVDWLWELRIKSELGALFHKRVREMGVHPSVDEHRRIYNALSRRDPEQAKRAMLDHIAHSIQDGEDLLDYKL